MAFAKLQYMEANLNSGNEARQVINSRWPALGLALDAAGADTTSPPIVLQLDKSGPVPTLCVDDIRLASAWVPEKEAELQRSVLHPNASHITLFGVGMSYLLRLLLQRLPDGGVLTVVPMNLRLFDQLLQLVDMMPWLEHPCVELRLAETYTSLPANSIVTPPLLQLADQAAEPVRDWFSQKLSESHVHAYQQTNDALVNDNLSYNLEHNDSDEDIGTLFSDVSKATNSTGLNRAAVVVGAGPSLDYTADQIHKIQQDGARVIAVDAALASLLGNNIVPDFVVSIDPLDIVARLFDVDQSLLVNSSLVYFPTVHRDTVNAWKQKRYTAIGGHSRFYEFSRKKPSTVLFSSGSVIHPAVDLAVRLGAENVYLAGADFGFPFEMTHARGSAHAANRDTINSVGQKVRNYNDEEFPSQWNYISYFRDLEQYIESKVARGIRFHNLGHYSARIRHVSCIPLAA